MLLLIQDQNQETGCPSGFPRLETHQNDGQHGDVCRPVPEVTVGGFKVGWVCPKECKVTQNQEAPFCKLSSSNGAACRVIQGTSFDCK